MPRILVIADDLTGAAEIGGIAKRYGLDVQLLRTPAPPPVDCDVVVYDTDSRLLPAPAAAAKTLTFATAARAGAFDLVFKKTDSVLRGEPYAEIDAVATRFGRTDVLLLPQNPSRDRCIVDGHYTVGGMPLAKTGFAHDPLHPAITSDAVALLRAPASAGVRCVDADITDARGFVLANAGTIHDVAAWAERLEPGRQLAAGGADFFDAIVQRSRRLKPSPATVNVRRPLLYVSGTASQPAGAMKHVFVSSKRWLRMPDEVFAAGESAKAAFDGWAVQAATTLRSAGEAVVAIDRADSPSAGQAESLQQTMAAVAERVLQLSETKSLACEGGATAATLCERFGWTHFTVEAEIAPGIVMLCSTPYAPRVIFKPGSYAWPAF